MMGVPVLQNARFSIWEEHKLSAKLSLYIIIMYDENGCMIFMHLDLV